MAVKHYDWTYHKAHRQPHKMAIKDLATGRERSYLELDQQASQLAGWMQSLGLKKGDRAALLLRNSAEFFELQFACHKLGVIFLPLNWRLTASELSYILNDATPKLLLYDNEFTEVSKPLVKDCQIKHALEIDLDSQDSYPIADLAGYSCEPAECTHDDVSTIMYTSGTTGHPKGALITFGMAFYNCVNLGTSAGITGKTIQLVVLPLFHTGGLNCYANPVLHAGGSILIMRAFDPGQALAVIGDPGYAVTHFFAVPAPYQFMMNHPDFEHTDLSRLESAGVGGAPCPEAMLDAWLKRGVPMVQGWGMTETSPGGTSLEVADAMRKIGSAGKPLHHTEVKVVTPEGCIAKPGEIGELMIKGPNVTPGYWQNPEATEQSIVDGWLATGDAARIDEEGFVYIVDRWKDMYISGGENVYPAEVENVLYQLPQIAEAAVFGIPSEQWGETGKAVLVLKPNATLEADEVIAHCLKHLAKFKIPAAVDFVEVLPRNAAGKILKRVLKDQT